MVKNCFTQKTEVMENILKIADFVLKSFYHIWPYLLITIPLAVAVNLSGAAKLIHKALSKQPVLSVILATFIGAFSPFCSCGVIPVITSLLIGGVPLGPVMSFWIASPSMDPEIFFLSVSSVGWQLSIWRLAATFLISLAAGLFILVAQKKGYINKNILRANLILNPEPNAANKKSAVQLSLIQPSPERSVLVNCCADNNNQVLLKSTDSGCSCNVSSVPGDQLAFKRILREAWKSFIMVARFMALAFFINALIKFYVPENLIAGIIGHDNPLSVMIAALAGIPFYASNLTALPLINGLLTLGMNEGAALTFLIAGPVTTLPAMMAVWGIVKPKVFFVYLSFGLFGSLIAGLIFNLVY